eukprot:TRINITY_DN1385_c0_g1_i1.p1 TRINITY_DN1385_c0_g1~~TRINITY_DN1385_c0_g1_i1.p1  ORF type:complete len:2608 (-),score=472.89 TRINITY_DN1385_c0_g1_i1:198-7172(-)
MQKKPGLRIFAWDIECTKAPLKFPDSAHDQITMISIMADGSGFLIVNRDQVSADIEPLEYTPKPEYEGIFDTFNEEDEAGLLRRFFTLIRQVNPHAMVSFNGDFFDYPFVTARAKAHNLDWMEESGIQKIPGEDYFAGKWIVHLDCFAWVQRDSMLPCGARGLKAVTRYKLKYDPVELDPEDMTPFAKERPQELAAYSVSDAVATYYLYMKYIHDFVFALSSIIPYCPDDVLRKGSGTLCESLLMGSAQRANVLFPNKHVDPALEFHEGTNRLIEQSTYEGARVECMRVGVFRAEIKETFQLEPSQFQKLLSEVRGTVDFYLLKEEKVKMEDVLNYEETIKAVEDQLRAVCDPDKVAEQIGRMNQGAEKREGDYNLKLVEYEVVVGKAGVKEGGKKVKKSSYRVISDECPLIYHLDVGAMYPNIILSNRLQPMAIVSREFCNSCTYNDPSNNCKRDMDWKWRGELYMATRADVRAIINEMESEKRRYNQKDRETGEIKRVQWGELKEAEKTEEIRKAVRAFSQKAHSRVKSSIYEDKTDTVCQRENPFYVDTVLNFRDRRYTFKRLTKTWNKALEKAEEKGDLMAAMEAKDLAQLNDSLQLAHKVILNSFYGYVMRKGARWHSMKMAGIVTFTGSNLIREAREFCETVGLPIELDTDGIWCMLPKSFPDNFKILLKGGKDLKMPYSNCVLNYRVFVKYTNHQYQTWKDGKWETSSENSILFEIDGPYKAMVLPASTEEDVMLKKRYAVYEFDGSLAELKGFELKRRGELRLIQVFQQEVFPVFLKGDTKQEVWDNVGAMANRWLDVIESRGKTMTDDEVIYFFSESKSMSKSVEESGNNKSVQITTARRLSEFLGVDTMLKDAGLSCHLFISRKPQNESRTARAIPVKIFFAEEEVKKFWLRKWLQDSSLASFDMRDIIDWEYYKERLCAVFLKLIVIPCSYQKMKNPCPRVPLPLWLHKRVVAANDKYQQRSLGLWVRKVPKAEDDNADEAGGKRKAGDLEDLAGPDPAQLTVAKFGSGPKKWLEVQRLRWAASKHASSTLAPQPQSGGARRASLFDASAAWLPVATDVLQNSWHVVAIEPAHATRTGATLKVGDSVIAEIEIDEVHDDMDAQHADETTEIKRGVVVGFVGGMVRVMLEHGEEQLVKRSAVQLSKEEGLFTLWVASGQSLTLHRCDVLAKRNVILALESDFNPEAARRAVNHTDLRKGVQVWSRDSDRPGVIVSAAPEIGLCGVKWESGEVEAVFGAELAMKSGSAVRVRRDAPRNLQHACLVELELTEEDFQTQRGEGALGDRDSHWPRVDSIYEADMPLQFDLMCRLGPVVKVASPEKVEQGRSGNSLRIDAKEFVQEPRQDYLRGLLPSRNIYLHLCFDRARPSRTFCGIYAPANAEAWACFGGLDPTEGESMRHSLEAALSEQLAQAGSSGASEIVRAEVSFVGGKSLNATIQWAEHRIQDLRKHDGSGVCVICSQLSTGELRGIAPSLWVNLKHNTAFREVPICRSPFFEADSNFPALDWPRWISRRFTSKVPRLFGWWMQRLALCRAAGLPICNAPESISATVPVALDALYSCQLQRDSQLRWCSPTSRPDLGQTSLSLVDAQEESVEVMSWVLQGKTLSAGNGQGLINKPGVYRSICLEINLRTKLCICALQHARYISDMTGGELSRKLIRKMGPGDSANRNLDHCSEASVTNLESLVTMVQQIAAVRDAKEQEIVSLRKSWASQGDAAKAALQNAGIKPDTATNDDDDDFVQVLADAGFEDVLMANKLEEVRTEYNAQKQLLDGLYGWLASPTSLLYDAALLRKVHQYMDKVLQLLEDSLRKNGCNVIHASYSKVLFETGKLRIIPDIQIFWESLCNSIQSVRALEPLALPDQGCLGDMFYGVLWLGPSDWAGIPIDTGTGIISWKVQSCWKIADFLPPAVRPSLLLYAGDLLLGPQRELGRRFGAFAESRLPHEVTTAAAAAAAEMEVDADEKPAVGCMDGVDDNDDDDDEPDAEKDVEMAADAQAEGETSEAAADAAAAAAAAATAAKEDEGGAQESAQKAAKVLEEVREYVRDVFFEDLRRRVLKYIDDLQTQHQNEMSGNFGGTELLDAFNSDSESEDEEETNRGEDSVNEAAQARKQQRIKQHLEEKWSFPEIPGRMSPPAAVEFEFMKALISILMLDEVVIDQVEALRDRMCQKLKMSSFLHGLSFESPCFPLILRNVTCPWCCVASHVDVTSHPANAPGLWVCQNCNKYYDKDAMQARLVDLLHSIVQAWQSQEVVCKKCKGLRTAKMQNFCECFGRYQLRFTDKDFRLVVKVLGTLTGPHDLPWLRQTIDLYKLAVQ